MSIEQAGTLHSLLSIGSQQSTQVHSRTAVSPDTTHGVTQGTNGVSTSRQPKKVMQKKKFLAVKTAQKSTPQKGEPQVTPEKVIPEKKVMAEKVLHGNNVTPEKAMSEKVSCGKNVTPQNVMPEKKVTPQTSSPEKSDDEHQVENGIVGSKRHPTVLVCNNENCTLKRSPMGCSYQVAMRIKNGTLVA